MMNFTPIDNKGLVEGFCIIKSIEQKTSSKGDAYLDMMLGDRLSSNYFEDNKRPFHGIGNWLVRFLVNKIYHGDIVDIMTGYRAFSKRFVKGINLVSDGFEIETEMSIYALKHKCKIDSVPIDYKDRPDGSLSKLNTFSDGFKVIRTIFKMRYE